jgi:hypothetical protein
MTVKCTWLFNGVARDKKRVWGFSETWYSGLSAAAVLTPMNRVSNERRQLLAQETSIIGYRIQELGGRAFVVKTNFTAPRGNGFGNLPVDSVLCQVGIQNTIGVKRFFLHDLPDDWIDDNDLDPAKRLDVFAVINAYTFNGFQVRALNPAALNAPVLSIDTLGNVVTTAAMGIGVNTYVSFLRCRDINNRPVRGQFVVDQFTDTTHFRLAHWTGQVVPRSGRVRASTYQFAGAVDLGEAGIIRAASRKVGRPFFQKRGRVSNRR